MHSGTKYIGGHSDLLCGVLATTAVGEVGGRLAVGLRADRVFLGSVMGGLEGWLGVRSLRTLELRVGRQSQSAEELVRWLDGCVNGGRAADQDAQAEAEAKVVKRYVDRVQHASLQREDMGWLKQQMPNGFGPVFAIWMRGPAAARALPSKLKLFHHATSLGGVESLIEWRRMSDHDVDERLLRVSVGVEDWRDLKADLAAGLRALVEEGLLDGESKEVQVRKNGSAA